MGRQSFGPSKKKRGDIHHIKKPKKTKIASGLKSQGEHSIDWDNKKQVPRGE